jgi:hypothetical protein
MNIRKVVEKTVKNYLNESLENNLDIKGILIKRIPFLKEYKIIKNPISTLNI